MHRTVLALALLMVGLSPGQEADPLTEAAAMKWSDKSVGAWVVELHARDATRSGLAAIELGALLGQSLDGGGPEAAAIAALGETDIPEQVGRRLGALLNEPETDMINAAFVPLSMGHPGVAQAGLPGLKQALEAVPRLQDVEGAYDEAGERWAPGLLTMADRMAKAAGGDAGKDVRPLVVRLLPDRDDPRLATEGDEMARMVADAALETLGELGPLDPQTLARLGSYLLPTDSELCGTALRALKVLAQADAEIVAALSTLAQHQDRYLREEAEAVLRALAKTSLEPELAEAVQAALESQD